MSIKFPTTGGQGTRALDDAGTIRNRSLQKLATGLRLINAADDSAGLAIAAGMDAQLRGLSQASRNANDGVSMTQVADSALSSVGQMLGRMRELSMQAANGTLNDEQRMAVDSEFQQLKQEIDRVVETTEFNGAKLLESGSIALQVGADAGDTIDVDTSSASTASLGVSGLSVGSSADAIASLSGLDAAIAGISSRRTDLGAVQNRLGAAMEGLSARATNMAAAKSRIEDVDVAAEVAELAMGSIREQASVALQAHANQNAALSLSLLG